MDAENTYDVAAGTTFAGASPYQSTNLVDHGSATGRGRGPSRGAFLLIEVTTDITGTSSLVFQLVQADDDAFSTNKETLATFTPADATPAAGTVIAQVALPSVTRRYTRVEATYSGTAVGNVHAGIITDPQASWA